MRQCESAACSKGVKPLAVHNQMSLAPAEVLINQAMMERFFQNEEPIGKLISRRAAKVNPLVALN